MTQLSLLSGTDAFAKSSENEQQMDGSQICKCGKGMSGCSIHPNTPDEWIAFMQDSLARILASPVIRQGLAKKRAVASTVKLSALLGFYEPNTSTWRMSQHSFLMDSEQSLQTWPRSGMTLNGYAYELPTVGRITIGIGGLDYVPTPTVTSGAQVAWDKTPRQTGGTTLAGYVKYWPTPTSRNAKETNAPSEAERNTPTLAAAVGGTLNPTWVEWLMGFPIGFTVLKDWETRKSRSKQQSPSQY